MGNRIEIYCYTFTFIEKYYTNNMNKKVKYAIIGAIAGLPLSYYFQPEILRQKISLLDYITNLGKMFEADYLLKNIFMSVVVFAAIGYAIGYFSEKNAGNQENP